MDQRQQAVGVSTLVVLRDDWKPVGSGLETVGVLEFQAPGAFERYYNEYEEIVRTALSEDERLKARAELSERYGGVWHDELVPEAMARFGIGP